MADVFISYSRSDQAVAAMLARSVEGAGYDVWWDAELAPHQSYGEVIAGKITSAKAAIVIWSVSAIKSEWVRAEADLARNQQKLIQTALNDIALPLPFNQIQFVDLSDWQGEADHPGWRKVRVSLPELCGEVSASPKQHMAASIARQATPQVAPMKQTASRWPLFAGVGLAVLVAISAFWWATQPRSRPNERFAEGLAAVWDVSTAQTEKYGESIVPNDVALDSRPDMVFPDSSTRLLQSTDLASLTPAMLKVAWGEILARKGFRFRKPEIFRYFSQCAWYRPSFDQVILNKIERENVTTIRQHLEEIQK